MSVQYCSMLPKFTDLMNNRLLYEELVNTENLTKDDCKDLEENLYDLNELEEVFSDHILMGKRLQKTLYRGHIDDLDEDTDHPPIALTDFALKLFSKAVPNYGLNQLDMDYVSSVSEATRISPCAMILALIYLERLQIKNSDYLESVSPSGLFVVTMLVASKFLFENEDDIVTNQIWAETLNLDIKELNELEKNFLSAIDWRLYVDSSDYFKYLSSVEKMVALKQASFRGWLSYSDMYSVLQDARLRESLLFIIERIIKVFAVATLGYAVAVLSVYTANVAIYCRYEYSLSTKENVQMKNEFPKSLPVYNNVGLEAVNSLLDDTSDIFSSVSLKNQNSYNPENSAFSKIYQSKIHKTVATDIKKHSLVEYIGSSSSLKEKSKHASCIHSNFFLTNVINHTLYELQWWPTGFNNACISISVK